MRQLRETAAVELEKIALRAFRFGYVLGPRFEGLIQRIWLNDLLERS